MWINRIDYELLKQELEFTKKENKDMDDKCRALQWENFELNRKIKDLTSEASHLKSQNEAFLNTLLFGEKEDKKDDRDT